MLEHVLPVDAAEVGDVEDGFQVIDDFQKGYILETEGAVGDDTLKLLAERLHILRGLQQITAPVDSGGWVFHHHLRTGDGLGDDALGDDVVDAGVVIVLLLVVPKIEVGKRLPVEILG